MKRFVCLVLAAMVAAGASAWFENFDGYANGQQLHGLNGWVGWDNNPAAGALVSNAQSFSAPHSLEILGASDLVRTFTGVTSGLWAFTGEVFIPSNFTGTSYFIMLNTYNHGGPYNWSVQIHFDAATNTADDDFGTHAPVPIVRNQWMDLLVNIDLGADSRTVFLGGNQVSTGTWTQTNGALAVAAIDLFANNAPAAYYDDLGLVPEPSVVAALGLASLALLRRRR